MTVGLINTAIIILQPIVLYLPYIEHHTRNREWKNTKGIGRKISIVSFRLIDKTIQSIKMVNTEY